MDKNTIIGFVLMAAVLIGFTILNKPSDEELAKQREQIRRDSLAYALNMQESLKTADELKTSTGNKVDDFFAIKTGVDSVATQDSLVVNTSKEEKIYTLENNKLKVQISSKGGQVISAQIKGYHKFDGDSLYLFNNDAKAALLLTNKDHRVLSTENLHFEAVGNINTREVTLRYTYGDKQHVDFVYMLTEDDYLLKYDITMQGLQGVLDRDKADIFELEWSQRMRSLEKSRKNEQQYSHIRYRYTAGDSNGLAENKNEELEVKEPTKWVAFKNQFFSSILIADKQFETVLLDSRVADMGDYLKTYDAKFYLPADTNMEDNVMHAGLTYYFGPLGYSHLKSYDENVKADSDKLELEELVPLGWAPLRVINKYFVIPIFNFLNSTGMSMGLVILLLTLIVKLIISPLTYKSFMSSAKMRVLRPQVEEINAKYPKADQATEKQQAVMGLYSRAGANPMSGCIPMLLQMPILIALFRFFPTAIELRQRSFLWADDLSTYDAVINFPFTIPFLGDHLSLFCILMTITNVIYTKFNMDATNTGQEQMPGMKWMMYLMPVIFLFVLNDFPSGLTYYYFISLLITILLTLGFRYFVDEEKVLAKLEANKAKPKKKSGFMARLEEAQRAQQQQMKQQNKKKR